MTKSIPKILILLIIVSCSPLKRLKTVTQGKVKQKDYLIEIPFKYVNDQIILPVTISNVKYDFVFDTGNPLTSIDGKLLEQIQYKSNNVSYDIGDSQGNTSNNKYISIQELKLGEIEFQDIGGQVFDHSIYDEITGCDGIQVRGIIGSNLMRKSIWQIDYDKKIITITDSFKNFKISSNSLIINTKSGRYGDAFVEMQLNGNKEKFVFDTGYNGFIYTDLKVLDKMGDIQKAKSIISSFTATGKYQSEVVRGYVNNITLNNSSFDNQIVNFSKGHSNLIGNKFIEHFLVTMDWRNELFYLSPKADFEDNILSTYELGFGINYSSKRVEFYSQQISDWSDNSFDLSSKILSINGINVDKMGIDELCQLWKNENNKIYTENITLEIIKGGVKKKIILDKKQLLPN